MEIVLNWWQAILFIMSWLLIGYFMGFGQAYRNSTKWLKKVKKKYNIPDQIYKQWEEP